ncbi:hypothetical protein ALP26_04663 [Pseudomonas savastanoi pv. glycinea]|uniref:HTH lysR-type domain-containing protein n=1 Tax=Pseudomonas savastanoi pv. glycinea TaxID=318 RepID=A0A3M3K0H8_PSESG|nr:hypothetical protein ALQ69_05346 [Pseudomonas savastanoi pv. glycinea]RMN00268.1 hypothetical protein ALQ68_04920 [Pseudomonas savastanoi pv. glycinea]RMN11077.1 hypothetical protein ALQ67_04891 [Pseudomonas savastanoi pv. glycinea]RMN16628.1 hypothetical protein ALQ66_05222 [Pseudomonas savastanoi pv. glycinea]RMO38354.1 hypothetical protein ALQ41_04667 [Pseudomonas savastanoi pv. glycinea]
MSVEQGTTVKARSDELQVFVSVIESGSISAAAEKMGQTPSGVSRTLSRLEAKLETTLINRTTRRMDLTEEGKFFLERARQDGKPGRKALFLPADARRPLAYQCRITVHAALHRAACGGVSSALPGYRTGTQQ